MIIPEILAPAGSFDSLRAAVWAGANAVYLGGKSFSARASAANFSFEELDKAVLFAHRAGVRLYVTVNTLLKEQELEPALKFIEQLYNLGVDAIIMQDIGAARLVRRYLPRFELHASTQTTTTSLGGVTELKALGFDRVVLARELREQQVREIASAEVLPVEVFVHGALCVAYSGQCLYSSMAGGRSGNRGMCAQVCRLPSQLLKQSSKGYLLSPKDLCLIGQVPLLMSLQAASWKIEGRARGADYVAEAVSAYRQARDNYLARPHQFAPARETLQKLQQAYNRGFTEGLLLNKSGQDFYNHKWPGHHGLPVAEVVRGDASQVILKVQEQLHAGDVLGFVGVTEQLTLARGAQKGDVIKLPYKSPASIPLDEPAVRLFNAQRSSELRSQYLDFEPDPQPVKWWVEGKLGHPLKVNAQSGSHSVAVASNRRLQQAENVTLTEEVIYKQLSRLGGTPFQMQDCLVNLAGELYLPLSEVNECRRQALEGLERKLWRRDDPQPIEITGLFQKSNPIVSIGSSLGVSVASLDEAQVAEKTGADWLVLGKEWLEQSPRDYMSMWSLVRDQVSVPVVIRLPRIMTTEEEREWDALIPEGVEVLASSLGAVRLASAKKCIVRGDVGLNVFNSHTVSMPGLTSATVSAELNRHELQDLAAPSPLPLEVVVHGRHLLMVKENCLMQRGCATHGSGCHHQDILRDRKGFCFPVNGDYKCRSYVLNSHVLSLIGELPRLVGAGYARLRLELAGEGPLLIEQTIELYRKVLTGNGDGSLRSDVERLWGELTRGHWQRGVT